MKLFLFLSLLTLSMPSTAAEEGSSSYISGKAGKDEAATYVKAQNVGPRYLAYRDLGPWLNASTGRLALDYGAGLGFSSDFLQQRGFSVESVDISESMIAGAKEHYPQMTVHKITANELPYPNEHFHLIFSSLVLFELPTKDAIKAYISEAARVLKDDGVFVAVTGSTEMHNPSRNWGVLESNFPENQERSSGSLVKVHLKEANLSFSDYYWTSADYHEQFAAAGLTICATHLPLGKGGEAYDWKDELEASPILAIFAAKDCARHLQ